MSRHKGRILAFQAVYSWELNKVPANELLEFSWLKDEKNSSDFKNIEDFSKLLALGTIENIKEIDKIIEKHLENWDIARVNKTDLAIIRISVYSLVFQNELQPSIVIDEAVRIAREFGTDDSYKFVNGILDNISKNRAEIKIK